MTFPADYHAEALKGKAAKFASKLHKVEERGAARADRRVRQAFLASKMAALNLRGEVRKNMERELAQAPENSVKEQVLNGLVEANQIDHRRSCCCPGNRHPASAGSAALRWFQGRQRPELPAELFQAQAERRVRVGLLLGDVIRTNEIKADDARVTSIIESMATAYEDPKEVIEYYQQNEQMLNGVRNLAVEDQAIDLILSKAQVTEKEVASTK